MTNEEAIKQLEEFADYLDTHVPAMGGDAMRMGAAALRVQQEVNSRNPHGKWKLIRRMADGAEMKCSVCGRSYIFNSFFRLENCPFCHCGAKMDGVIEVAEETVDES